MLFLQLVLLLFLFFFGELLNFPVHSLVTVQSLIPVTSAQVSDAVGLSEIVAELNVATVAVLLLQSRFKPIYGEFLSLVNRNSQQSITFDDRQKFLLWVEDSQKLGYGTTTLVFGKPKDLIEEVGIWGRLMVVAHPHPGHFNYPRQLPADCRPQVGPPPQLVHILLELHALLQGFRHARATESGLPHRAPTERVRCPSGPMLFDSCIIYLLTFPPPQHPCLLQPGIGGWRGSSDAGQLVRRQQHGTVSEASGAQSEAGLQKPSWSSVANSSDSCGTLYGTWSIPIDSN